MNQVARLAFVLFGFYVVIEGFVSVATTGITTAGYPRLSPPDHPVAEWFGFLGLAACIAIVLCVVPGILLVKYSNRLANLLFPAGTTGPILSASEAYSVGCALIATMVVLNGFVGGATTAFTFASDAFFDTETQHRWRPALVGLVQVALGVLLYRHARRHLSSGSAV